MKRTVVAVLSVVLSTAALAEEAQRYIVTTRPSVRVTSQSDAARIVRDVEPRRVRTFNTLRGFAADLTRAEAEALRESGDVRWVEPVLPRNAAAIDPNVYRQIVPWGIADVRAPQANLGTRTGVVNVVVADTGIDQRHPELRDAYAGGWNTFNPNLEQHDDNGHGTHVAGTIAAADNDRGVVGVAPNVRLWAVKVLDHDGHGYTENVLAAVDWAIAQRQKLGGQWVVNLSLSGGDESPSERDAMQHALDSGVIVVAASGNFSDDVPVPVAYPAAYPAVVAVGAIQESHSIAKFSCQGPELDLVAPGVGVLSTSPVGEESLAYLADGSEQREVWALIGSGYGTVTAPFVFCGVGEPDQMPESLAGKIALFQRGVHKFAEKARRAVAHGAVGVVIFNNEDADMRHWTLFAEPEDEQATWPITIQLSRADGEKLQQRGSGTLTLVNEPYDYTRKNGTSMATPHVTGAVALLWSLAPDATPQQVLDALYSTAADLGTPGFDTVFGHGEIDLYAAARALAPTAFAGRRRAVAGNDAPTGAAMRIEPQPITLGEIFATPEHASESDGVPGAPEVVMAKIGTDGKPVLACVESEVAARRFLDAKPDGLPTKQPKDQ